MSWIFDEQRFTLARERVYRRKVIGAVCEAYAGTATQSLQASSLRERPVDRVGAAGVAGRSHPIGLLLIKARDGLDSAAYRELNERLYKAYRARYGDIPVIAAAVVGQALHEFLVPRCRRCQGTREVLEGDLKASCPDCYVAGESTGLHRYTDTERATSMKISYGQTKRAGHKIRWIIELLATQDRAVEMVMAGQLER